MMAKMKAMAEAGAAPGGPGPGPGRGEGPHAEASDPNGLSLFGALQEKLGLKLETRKSPVEMLVVDSGEKVPTEN